jgi:hypothetical protein
LNMFFHFLCPSPPLRHLLLDGIPFGQDSSSPIAETSSGTQAANR